MDIDIVKIQEEIIEMRKAGLSDGFDEGYSLGYKAAMVEVYMDIDSVAGKATDAEKDSNSAFFTAFKVLSKQIGDAITKKGGKLSGIPFTLSKQQFMDDEKLD